MEGYKTCPFKKATESDLIMFQNVEVDAEVLAEHMKNGEMTAMRLSTEDGAQYVGPVMGRCDGEHCALWNKTGRCCTFASMVWSLRQLIAAVNEQKGGLDRCL